MKTSPAVLSCRTCSFITNTTDYWQRYYQTSCVHFVKKLNQMLVEEMTSDVWRFWTSPLPPRHLLSRHPERLISWWVAAHPGAIIVRNSQGRPPLVALKATDTERMWTTDLCFLAKKKQKTQTINSWRQAQITTCLGCCGRVHDLK